MTDTEILGVCSRVLGQLLDDDGVSLGMDTRRADVPGWDSLAYINFIAAIELELGVRFSIADVESFENVGAIVHQARALGARAG
jgi:acyl carrier protein